MATTDKRFKGNPHMKGMPADYLSGHTENHLNAHNSHVGKLMMTHDRLGASKTGGPGKATEDETPEV